MAEQKTNVMRVLDQKKIRYLAHEYPHGDAPVDGETVASLIGKDADCVYKTLVTRQYPTFFDSAVNDLDTVIVSAGKIGAQVELAPAELIRLVRAATADIAKEQ